MGKDSEMSREDLIQLHFDLYKSYYGFRPWGIDYSQMTVEQLEDEIEMMEGELVNG